MITSQDTWLVDSGASTHMTGYREVLSDFKKKSCSAEVELGDEVRYEVNGVGSISFSWILVLFFIWRKFYMS